LFCSLRYKGWWRWRLSPELTMECPDLADLLRLVRSLSAGSSENASFITLVTNWVNCLEILGLTSFNTSWPWSLRNLLTVSAKSLFSPLKRLFICINTLPILKSMLELSTWRTCLRAKFCTGRILEWPTAVTPVIFVVKDPLPSKGRMKTSPFILETATTDPEVLIDGCKFATLYIVTVSWPSFMSGDPVQTEPTALLGASLSELAAAVEIIWGERQREQ